jgi:hypothetical protein
VSKIFRYTKNGQLSDVPVNGLYQGHTSPGLRERELHPRELADRSNDGLEMTLFWRAGRDEVTVCGSHYRSGVSFEIRPERHLALYVYYTRTAASPPVTSATRATDGRPHPNRRRTLTF